VRGANIDLKLDVFRTAAACLPGADAKSLNALLRTGKLVAQGKIE
jgi:hypothetical protein